jgi:hypothetical protein
MSATTNTYTALITSQHQTAPKFLALVAAFAQPSVDQQNELLSWLLLFDLDTAVGDQLDKLGGWIGASRTLNQAIAGVTILPDSTYRILLKLIVAENVWDGTVPGAYKLWNALFAREQIQILIQDNQDMTMTVIFLNPPNDPVELGVLEAYFNLRPAGVRITGFATPTALPIFGFDREDATVSGFDVGNWLVFV